MSFLEIESVSKRFGSVTALDAISLSAEAGSRTAIVGPSGSGKSTLLRIVAGFEAPDSGCVRLEGESLANGGRILPPHLRSIGLVSQDGALFPHLDLAGNIGFGIDRRAFDRAERIRGLMAMVELDPSMIRRRPHELSGGQQQRVALARALARRPKLMLLDEPFSALDTGLRDAMRRMVAGVLAREGIAAILVTHDQTEALSFSDQVAVLREGKLVQAGPPRILYSEPMDTETAAFLGEAIVMDARIDAGWAECALGLAETEPHGPDGAARVLIRPEQLRLEEAYPGEPPKAGFVHGRVVEVEFRGAVCRLQIALSGPQAPARPVETLRDDRIWIGVSSPSAPALGTSVAIRIEGRVRGFPPAS